MKSILLSRPGVGKNAIRRLPQICQVVEHVIIIDTSNEIATDGDLITHQLEKHVVCKFLTIKTNNNKLLEKVENHMPEINIMN